MHSGLLAEDYANAHVSSEADLHWDSPKMFRLKSFRTFMQTGRRSVESPLYPNQFVCFRNENNPKQGGLTRWKPKQRQLVKVDDRKEGV